MERGVQEGGGGGGGGERETEGCIVHFGQSSIHKKSSEQTMNGMYFEVFFNLAIMER